MRKTGLFAGLLVASVAAVSMLAGPVSAQPQPAADATPKGDSRASLTLVHGIPGKNGFPVDVYLDRLFGKDQVFKGVTFTTVAGPLSVKAGLYEVDIRPAGAPRHSEPVLSKRLVMWPGASRSVVAHLSEKGAPRLNVYTNNLRSTGGKARVTVRHDAAAPAVDILAGDTPVIEHLANPAQRSIKVPAGTYPISVAASSDGTVVFGPANLTFGANTLTIVYAVGDLAGGSFTPLIQVLPTA